MQTLKLVTFPFLNRFLIVLSFKMSQKSCSIVLYFKKPLPVQTSSEGNHTISFMTVTIARKKSEKIKQVSS